MSNPSMAKRDQMFDREAHAAHVVGDDGGCAQCVLTAIDQYSWNTCLQADCQNRVDASRGRKNEPVDTTRDKFLDDGDLAGLVRIAIRHQHRIAALGEGSTD